MHVVSACALVTRENLTIILFLSTHLTPKNLIVVQGDQKVLPTKILKFY